MRKLAEKYLSVDYIRIRIGRAGSAHSNIIQRVRLLHHLVWRCAHRQIGHLVRPEQQEAGHLRPSSVDATFAHSDLLQFEERCRLPR
jgi:hypothetical protein